MRAKGKGTLIKSFGIPLDKIDVYSKFEEIAKNDKVSVSELITHIIENFVIENNKALNPQTKIEFFQNELELGAPTIYADSKIWNDFYKKIKRKEEFKHIDQQLNTILSIHNKRDKELG